MNDDFLRRVRRPPPPAFANQLKERLRQLEVAESSRRRPNWRVLTIPLLIGGSVLAAATYLTIKHVPLLLSPSSEVAQMPTADAPQARSNAGQGVTYRANPAYVAPASEAWADAPSTAAEQPQSSTSGTRDDSRSSASSASSVVAGLSKSSASTRSGAFTEPPVRVLLAHDVATIMDISRTKSLSDDVEVTSTDAAFRALCAESPMQRPDVIFASRPIQEEELLSCSEHGAVGGLLVAKVGHMAMVITGAKDNNPLRNPMRLSRDALLRALLKRIPSPDDPAQLIDNPYTHWNQIDPLLDDRRIEVLGPNRDSPEFVVFAATLLEPACDRYPVIRNLQRKDRSAYEELCFSLREGAYTPAPLDGNFVRQRLWSNPGALAVVDYRFYSGNSADLLGSLLTGVTPTLESIVDGPYAGARTVHLYVTRARYDGARAVKSFIDTYLRNNDFAQGRRLLILPNGETDWWKARPAQLTDVRPGTQRK